ncbi:hypothetical protein OIV83_004217 [Microbotryomycetes sp. JL201]|nr:hypothetical protein OIV83_004217 [Microbotryomycetes sp. JL201]
MARSTAAIGVLLALVAAVVWQSSAGALTWLHHNTFAPSTFPAILAKFPSCSSHSPASHGGHRIDYVRVRPSPAEPREELARDNDDDFGQLASCEDLTEFGDQETSQIVIATCDRSRHEWNTVMGQFKNPQPKGSLWYLTPLADKPHAHNIKLVNWPRYSQQPSDAVLTDNKGAKWATGSGGRGGNIDKDFHPLGLRFIQDGSRLFVINHERLYSSVEVFQLSTTTPGLPLTARYLMTIKHSSFNAPNAIQPVSSNSFYLSHDHKYNKRSTRLIDNLLNFYETIFAKPWSRVDFVTFDDPPASTTDAHKDVEVLATNVRSNTVATGIGFANGIAYSPSDKLFAVSSSTHRTVHVYDVNPINSTLSNKINVAVPFLPDNLSLAPKQFVNQQKRAGPTFIATGHPAYLPMLLEALNVSTPDWFPQAGSWTVSMTKLDGDQYDDDETTDDDVAYTSGRAKKTRGWKLSTLFASKGGYKHDKKSFGTSSTAVVGVSKTDAGEQRWMVVSGLYEKGLQLIRQV